MTERIKWVDALKFFAIFLVLWGHCIQYFLSSNYYDEPVYRIIYSFHMPLFMALSGFFINRSLDRPFLTVIKDKSRQLLLPILSYAIIFLIVRKLSKWGGVDEIFWFFHVRPQNGFWFLKSAFICSITYYLINQSKTLYIPLLLISLLASQYFDGYGWYQLSQMYPCFVLGAIIQKNFEWISRNAYKILICSGVIFIIMLIFWDASFWELPFFHDPVTGELSIDNILQIFYKRVYRLIIGVAGLSFFISLFLMIGKRIEDAKVGTYMIRLGRETLGIYILQFFILEIIMAHYIKFDDTDFFIFNFIIAPIISLCVLIICILIIKVIRKYDWISFFLIGNKSPEILKAISSNPVLSKFR